MYLSKCPVCITRNNNMAATRSLYLSFCSMAISNETWRGLGAETLQRVQYADDIFICIYVASNVRINAECGSIWKKAGVN
jgi:hypothetical protein